MKIKFEICANSLASAIIGEQAGADRLELCKDLAIGGLTPSIGDIEMAKKTLKIPVYVLIRPRGGDFVYSVEEFEIMKQEVHACGKLRSDGVVIGMLHANGTIDTERCLELIHIAKAYDMGVTFHRAFDVCSDMYIALEEIIFMGCERILTSGGKKSALDGSSILCDLINRAGNRIIVMPGAGITEHNIVQLIGETNLREFHGSFTDLSSTQSKLPIADIDRIKQALAAIL
ncbi:copper homeostasis protein [Bacteroidales bacterium]|nr:copper homeostasis protein [Bacteroidales bacterium]